MMTKNDLIKRFTISGKERKGKVEILKAMKVILKTKQMMETPISMSAILHLIRVQILMKMRLTIRKKKLLM